MSAHRIIYRWDVPLDDKPHEIGGGKILMTQLSDRLISGGLTVWTEEILNDGKALVYPKKLAQIFGTGWPLPDEAYRYVGSALDPTAGFVWHLYHMNSHQLHSV